MSAKIRITKRAIEALEVTGKRYSVTDEDMNGFYVRVGVGGEKAFYFVYRAGKGRVSAVKWLRLGTFPTMTCEQARTLAKARAAQVALGGDPAQEVHDAKKAPFFAETIEMFFQEHVDAKLKASTQKSYRQIVDRHALPALRKIKIADVTHRHVAKLHHDMAETPYLANRCAAVLSKFFDWCEKNGYRERGTNPCAGLERYREEKRTVFMGREELEAIGDGFRKLEAQNAIDPTIAAALKVMLFTGARCSEILTLKWEYLNREAGLAHLPDSKTGAKALHIPPAAWAILNSLPRINDYCFTGRYGKGHIVNVKDTWKRVCESAGVSGWRIHDLRHAFASYAVNSGKSLPVIGAILGHSQPATTARYAHIADNPVTLATNETAAHLQRDLSGGKILVFKKTVGSSE